MQLITKKQNDKIYLLAKCNSMKNYISIIILLLVVYSLIKLGFFFYEFIVYAPLIGCFLLLLLFSIIVFFYSLVMFFKNENHNDKK